MIPDPNTMGRLYVEEGQTLRQIAEHLGLSQETVRRRLKELSVDLRPAHRPKHATFVPQTYVPRALEDRPVRALPTDDDEEDVRHTPPGELSEADIRHLLAIFKATGNRDFPAPLAKPRPVRKAA